MRTLADARREYERKMMWYSCPYAHHRRRREIKAYPRYRCQYALACLIPCLYPDLSLGSYPDLFLDLVLR